MPLSEHSLYLFAVFLAEQGIKVQSIKCYLSGIRHLHIAAGFPDFFQTSHHRLDYIIKGIKRTQSSTIRGISSPRLPITPTILRKIWSYWSATTPSYDQKMLWAAFCLGFFGFLRAGEFTVPADNMFDQSSHLSYEDIAVDSHTSPTILQVRLKMSKTDPFRHGISIYIGKTGNNLCPVAALLSYLAIRGQHAGPLFCFQDGRCLTRSRLVHNLRSVLSQVGVNAANYSGHSFRIGAASTAAAKGVPDSTIKMLGRWESSAYMLYIRTPREQLANIASRLSAP